MCGFMGLVGSGFGRTFQHSLMILLCLVQGCTLKCSPFIVNIDSIIDVHVQYLGSGEEGGGKREKERRGGKGGLHDLLHLFNTPLVIHNF